MVRELRAILSRLYEESTRAKALFQAVKPDNLKLPSGVTIISSIEKNSIQVEVRCDKGIGTLLSTLDDLLSCLSAAERTLEAVG